MTELRGGFPRYSESQLRHLTSFDELLYIEEGMDSIVVRWRQNDQEDTVLKYYVHSNISSNTLSIYAEAIRKAATSIYIEPLPILMGDISFEFVPIERVGSIRVEGIDVAVAQSRYITGLDLNTTYNNKKYLEDYYAHLLADLSVADRDHMFRWSSLWNDPSSYLRNDVSRKVINISHMLKNLFSSNQAYCTSFNTKLSISEGKVTLYITDIANSVKNFVKDLQSLQIN